MENCVQEITKKRLAKSKGVHLNTVTKWCLWAEPFLLPTGYKRRNRILTDEQIAIIWRIARLKYWMRCPWDNEKGKKGDYSDKRPFNNTWLFPKL
jgi:transposase